MIQKNSVVGKGNFLALSLLCFSFGHMDNTQLCSGFIPGSVLKNHSWRCLNPRPEAMCWGSNWVTSLKVNVLLTVLLQPKIVLGMLSIHITNSAKIPQRFERY